MAICPDPDQMTCHILTITIMDSAQPVLQLIQKVATTFTPHYLTSGKRKEIRAAFSRL
jgi:hypothetical protein